MEVTVAVVGNGASARVLGAWSRARRRAAFVSRQGSEARLARPGVITCRPG
jgi:hypothetical protein